MAKLPTSYWQHLFLHVAGLPTTDANIHFLSAWAANRGAANCDYNLLDLSQPEPGSTRCKQLPDGKWLRNYTDTQSAAQAFADQLAQPDYVFIKRALASGDPYTYRFPDQVASALNVWGAITFWKVWLAQETQQTPGSGSRSRPQSKNVGGAWTHLMRTLARDGHATIVELQKATARLNRIERRLRRA